MARLKVRERKVLEKCTDEIPKQEGIGDLGEMYALLMEDGRSRDVS